MIGVLEFDSRRELGIFLFTNASRTALGPTQPPIQWVQEIPSLGVKRLGREADHSLPSSAEVKEWLELYRHSPNTLLWRGAQLKHRDNFTFTFYKDRVSFYRTVRLVQVRRIQWAGKRNSEQKYLFTETYKKKLSSHSYYKYHILQKLCPEICI
jgi:hypothetical protein